METVTVTVEGISALLMHNPAGMAAPSNPGVGKKTIPTPEHEAEAGCYRLSSGQFYLPSEAFRSCMVRAATGRKIGKSAATSLVKGAVFAATEVSPLFDPSTRQPLDSFEIDSRRAVIQRQGIVRSRPKLPKWACEVSFECDDDFISETHIRELLTIGGRTVGVGDFRPEKSGPFGRFRLVET